MAVWLKDMVPMAGVLISTWVALLAIRRSDRRERDKQRRDDLTKMLGEFIEIASKLMIKMVKKTNAAVIRDALKKYDQERSFDESLLDVSHQKDSLVLRLEGAGEPSLSHEVEAHFAKITKVHQFVNEAVEPGNFELLRTHAEAQIRELGREEWRIGKLFIAELERLRKPRQWSIRQNLKTLFQRAQENWFKL
jgi:hypothetical protein